MVRTFIGGLAGVVAGLIALAAWGANDGWHEGIPTARTPPGFQAAATSAFISMVYLGPWAVILGGGAGGLAGFATGVVKPKTHSPSCHNDA